MHLLWAFFFFVFSPLLLGCLPLLLGIVFSDGLLSLLTVHNHLFNNILICLTGCASATPGLMLITCPALLTLTFSGGRSGSNTTRCRTIGWPDVDARLEVSNVVLQWRHIQVVMDSLIPDEPWSVHGGLEGLVVQDGQGRHVGFCSEYPENDGIS